MLGTNSAQWSTQFAWQQRHARRLGMMRIRFGGHAGRYWISGLCAAGLALAACGDDDEGQSSGAAEGGGGSQAAAGKPAVAGSGGAKAGAAGKSAAGSGGKSAAASGGKSAAGSGGKSAAGVGGADTADAGTEQGSDDAGAVDSPKQFKITLSTTACFGTCPVYEASIDQDGQVEFEGHEHVTQEGHASKQVPGQDARAVYDALRDAGYWQLNDVYRTEADGCSAVATDHPTYEWQVITDGVTKPLSDYLGCAGVAGLAKVRMVEALFEEKAAFSQWIGS
jgi:hypothetical protein